MADNKQPKVKKGTTFNGWAISNWGHLMPQVFRTRKDAQKHCIEHHGGYGEERTWDHRSKNHRLVKVKVTVI